MFCYVMLNSKKFFVKISEVHYGTCEKSERVHMLWESFVHSPVLSRDVILYIVASKHTAELLTFVEVSFLYFCSV